MWNATVTLNNVMPLIASLRIEQVFINLTEIVTFDKYGVSGHANHRSIFNALRHAKRTRKINIPIYTLDSVYVFRKFTFILDAIGVVLFGSRENIVFISSPSGYITGRKAMVRSYLR